MINGRVVTGADISAMIRRGNHQDRIAAGLRELGAGVWELADRPPSDPIPATPPTRSMLVGADFEPVRSQPPPPEIAMSTDSPFWHERALALESALEYTRGSSGGVVARRPAKDRPSSPKDGALARVEGRQPFARKKAT